VVETIQKWLLEIDWTVWGPIVSAISAAVQAGGAIAALGASLWIAYRANRRADKAEAASIRRAEAAEQRAKERLQEQLKRQQDAEVNRVIDVVGALTSELLLLQANHIEHLKHQPDQQSLRPENTDSIGYVVNELHRIIPAFQISSTSPDLTRALSVLSDNIRPTNFGRPLTIALRTETAISYRESIQQAYDALLALRR